MSDRDVVGGQAVAGRQMVDERRVWAADDLVEAMVFHDYDENVVEGGHRWLSHPATLAGAR
jgi:hypothetical protein